MGRKFYILRLEHAWVALRLTQSNAQLSELGMEAVVHNNNPRERVVSRQIKQAVIICNNCGQD
jgi:hypothetical protein